MKEISEKELKKFVKEQEEWLEKMTEEERKWSFYYSHFEKRLLEVLKEDKDTIYFYSDGSIESSEVDKEEIRRSSLKKIKKYVDDWDDAENIFRKVMDKIDLSKNKSILEARERNSKTLAERFNGKELESAKDALYVDLDVQSAEKFEMRIEIYLKNLEAWNEGLY